MSVEDLGSAGDGFVFNRVLLSTGLAVLLMVEARVRRSPVGVPTSVEFFVDCGCVGRDASDAEKAALDRHVEYLCGSLMAGVTFEDVSDAETAYTA